MIRPLARYLRRLELRTTLRARERRELLYIDAPVIDIGARHDLVRPGQKVEFACLVVQGMACRFEKFGDGARQTTAIYVPGDMCDLHSVAHPTAGWGITALQDSRIAQVPHAELERVAAKYPRIARAFWRDTVTDASILSKWLSTITHLPAERRLAHFLSETSRRYEIAGLGGDAFRLRVSQEQIADALGMSSVHVQRIFRKLRVSRAIETNRLSITILDRDQLDQLAEYDDSYLLLNRS